MRKYSYLLALTVLCLSSLTSCDKKDAPGISSEDSIYVFIDVIMNSWYYWYETVPEVNIFQYNEPADLLDELIYKPIDNWSFIEDTATLNSIFEEGIYYGFGFMIRFETDRTLRVIYVYDNSTAYSVGMRKGNIVTGINGVSPAGINDFTEFTDDSPQTFQFDFIDNLQQSHQVSISKSNIQQNAVFSSKIWNHIAGKKIGYLSYQDFLGYGESELTEAFAYFKTNHVNELIVDLRYNSGGYISLAQLMAEILVPSSAINHDFMTYSHNALIAPQNDTTYKYMGHDLNLDLQRVFFITTKFTASASELVINCLEPYMEVYLIGSTTYGKPVGMYGFTFHEWYFYPVTVSLRNADGYGDFYNGLPVDVTADEALDKDWGDITDPNISQALSFIETGSFYKESTSAQISFQDKSNISALKFYRPLLLMDR
jgi:carboxyl-terminal processing protease